MNFQVFTAFCGGFLSGWIACSLMERRLRGGNIGRQRLIFNEGCTMRSHANPTTPKPKIIPTPQYTSRKRSI
jgi:hypothetical protein